MVCRILQQRLCPSHNKDRVRFVFSLQMGPSAMLPFASQQCPVVLSHMRYFDIFITNMLVWTLEHGCGSICTYCNITEPEMCLMRTQDNRCKKPTNLCLIMILPSSSQFYKYNFFFVPYRNAVVCPYKNGTCCKKMSFILNLLLWSNENPNLQPFPLYIEYFVVKFSDLPSRLSTLHSKL